MDAFINALPWLIPIIILGIGSVFAFLPELMHTTQERNLAQQREAMFTAQEQAEVKRIAFAKKKAEADQQPAIIAAQAGIEIAEHEARQMEERAKGKAKQIEIEATAEAGKVKQIGEAEATIIQSKGAATAKAYREQGAALTPEGLTAIEVMKLVSEGKIKIVPDVVAGGDGNSGGGLVNLLLADLVQRNRAAVVPVADEDDGDVIEGTVLKSEKDSK